MVGIGCGGEGGCLVAWHWNANSTLNIFTLCQGYTEVPSYFDDSNPPPPKKKKMFQMDLNGGEGWWLDCWKQYVTDSTFHLEVSLQLLCGYGIKRYQYYYRKCEIGKIDF